MRSRRVSTVCERSGRLRCRSRAGLHSDAALRLIACRGQATVEYALVVFALLAVVVACATLWGALDEGLFVDHAAAGASHHIGHGSPGGAADVLLY